LQDGIEVMCFVDKEKFNPKWDWNGPIQRMNSSSIQIGRVKIGQKFRQRLSSGHQTRPQYPPI